MANKPFNTRIQLKHDTEAHWELATGFSPKAGELIIYDVDAIHSSPRFKVGDGTTNVNELPFSSIDIDLATQTKNGLLSSEDKIKLDKANVYNEIDFSSIASFNDAIAANALNTTITIEPVQASSGDPSPENVRPISGWTGANVTRTGKNLLPITVDSIKIANRNNTWSGNSTTVNGITFTILTDDVGNVTGINANGTSTGSTANLYLPLSTIADGTSVIINGCPNGEIGRIWVGDLSYRDIARDTGSGYTFVYSGVVARIWIQVYVNNTLNNIVFKPMIRIASDADPTFTPYTGTTIPISWQSVAGTVYGGTLDVTTGLLTVTMVSVTITSGNIINVSSGSGTDSEGGKRINTDFDNAKAVLGTVTGNIISNKLKPVNGNNMYNGSTANSVSINDLGRITLRYGGASTLSEAQSAVTGADIQIVYELAVPQTYQLTPTEVEMLLGDNNVWADAGDIFIRYLTNDSLGINKFLNSQTFVETDPTVPAWAKAATITDALGFTPLDASLKGANSGIAELDSNGKVPSSQLPSYVDDVLEYIAKTGFPSTGETGKIYVDTATNKTYRWSGSDYVEISASLALGTTSSTAYRGDYGNAAYTHAVTNKGSAFSSGLYKITTNSEGHVTDATAVAKSDITGLGIPGSDTTYTFDGTYNASTNKAATVSTVTNAIAALDGNLNNTTPGAGKTLTAFSETDGKVSATFGNISITKSQVSDLGTIGAAAAKSVDTSIEASSTSTNLPTSQAVAAFVEGKGYKTTDNNTTYSLTQDSSDGHKITLTPSSGTAQTITIPDNNTDTKVTSAANHYIPSRDTSADKSASASGATAAWSIDVVKGVTVQTDGKGHVTGVAVTSGKIPGNPNTDTHRPVQVNGTQILGNDTTALNLKAGSNVSITNSSGTVTIAATDTNTWRPVSDSVSSTSSSDAASSKAVKTAYDLAASKTANTGTVTSVAAGTGLSGGTITTSGTLSVSYGNTAGTACQGNDSRLSDSRNAKDVYSWAKASTKPSYTYSEVGAMQAPLFITTSNTSASDALTYGTATTLSTGRLVFVTLNKAMAGSANATLKFGSNTAINIYLTGTTQLKAKYAAGTMLGLVYNGTNLYMINPPAAV